MHTRAERKILPYSQPARGAAARSASLKCTRVRKGRCLSSGQPACGAAARSASLIQTQISEPNSGIFQNSRTQGDVPRCVIRCTCVRKGRSCPTGDPHAAQRLAQRALNAHACGRKMLPHRRPARRAAARSASLECTCVRKGRSCLTGNPHAARRLALRALT